MITSPIYQQRGFTLVELLLYLALSVVMLSVLGGIGINVLSSSMQAHAEEELYYNALWVTHSISAALDSAVSIESPVLGATSTTLVLTMEDPEKSPTVFTQSGDVITVQEGSANPMQLSGEDVMVTLQFTNVTPADASGSVALMLQLESFSEISRTDTFASSTFKTTFSIK